MKEAALTTIEDIQHKLLSLNDLFSSKAYYRVSEYQRGFSWNEEQFKQLFEDLMHSYTQTPDSTYLLGQVILCPTRDGAHDSTIDNYVHQWDIIDGQQRCTSLLILFVCLRTVLTERDWDTQSNRNKSIATSLDTMVSLTNRREEELPRVRAALNGQEYLTAILRNETLPIPTSLTQKNIEVAREFFLEEISREFKVEEDLTHLVDFLQFLMHRVAVVTLQVKTASQAVSIFQKVNNRGLSLDEADLVKSFLFLDATEDDYQRYSQNWDKASQQIFHSRLKRVQSMDFLIKLMIGIKTGESISVSKLYDRWSEILKGPEFPASKFAEQIVQDAECLSNISNGKYPDGRPGDSNVGLGIFQQKAIQQHEVQLAGKHLTSESYLNLLRFVEDRTLLSLWSGEQTQDFERIVHPWAKAVSTLDRGATMDEIKNVGQKSFSINSLNELISRAKSEITKWDYETLSHRSRLRYLLARIYHLAQFQVGEPVSIEECMKQSKYRAGRIIEAGFDLDHVLPKSADSQWRQDSALDVELGRESRFVLSSNSIGNLILLHSSDNRSQQDSLPWEDEKKTNLGASKFALNIVLVSEPYHGRRPKRISDRLQEWRGEFHLDSDNWGEKQINLRASLYLKLIEESLRNSLEF
jgi:uncharacterized protein with ParB-like and HNH nuclease domain